MEYTVYMPVNGGTVTISATGGTSLPVADVSQYLLQRQ